MEPGEIEKRVFEVSVERTETPAGDAVLAFSLGSQRIAVRETVDRWHGADHVYVKLRGEDGATYILRHDERTDRWAMSLFQADPNRATPMGPRDPPAPLLS